MSLLSGQDSAICAHLARDRFVEQTVGGNVDDTRPAMFIDQLAEFHDALEQKRLAAADREPVRRLAQRPQGSVPLVQGQLVLALHPDIAGEATRVTPRRWRESEVDGQFLRPAQRAIALIQGNRSQNARHRFHEVTRPENPDAIGAIGLLSLPSRFQLFRRLGDFPHRMVALGLVVTPAQVSTVHLESYHAPGSTPTAADGYRGCAAATASRATHSSY